MEFQLLSVFCIKAVYRFVSSNWIPMGRILTGLNSGPYPGVDSLGLEDVILVPDSPDSLAIHIYHNGRKAEC